MEATLGARQQVTIRICNVKWCPYKSMNWLNGGQLFDRKNGGLLFYCKMTLVALFQEYEKSPTKKVDLSHIAQGPR